MHDEKSKSSSAITGSTLGANVKRRFAYLRAMGVDVWVRRSTELRTAVTVSAAHSPIDQPGVNAPAQQTPTKEVSLLGWPELQQRVAACTLCDLHNTRTQTVFGVGDPHADWLFIGEAPGADEDRQGEPFVGRAGQLLNNMIRAIGLSREKVYIANILKCRPPRNRDPRPEEAQACRPYLRRQIELLNPRIIVALGRVAAQNLLQTNTPIGKMRGREYVYEDSGIPLVVTYHPAYLLRSPSDKRKAWQDLRLAITLATSHR